jgi:hypothetical protein
LFLPSAPTPDDATPTDPAENRIARYVLQLEDLAEVGMDLARDLRRQVLETPEAEPARIAAAASLAYARLARTIRQTFALAARLADEARTLDREAAKAAADRAIVEKILADDLERSEARRETVRAVAAQAIEADVRETGREGDLERLLGDLKERLEDDEDIEDYSNLPIIDIAERICRDLGVAFDPSLWEDEDWAIKDEEDQEAASSAGSWSGGFSSPTWPTYPGGRGPYRDKPPP